MNKILKEYLVQGYAINEKRLQQKQQEVEFLKTGLRIVSRALENASNEHEHEGIYFISVQADSKKAVIRLVNQ